MDEGGCSEEGCSEVDEVGEVGSGGGFGVDDRSGESIRVRLRVLRASKTEADGFCCAFIQVFKISSV